MEGAMRRPGDGGGGEHSGEHSGHGPGRGGNGTGGNGTGGNGRYGNVGSILDGYNRDGGAYDQVTRAKLEGLTEQVHGIESKLNAIAVGVFMQLLGFVLAVLLFAINHVRV